MMTHDSAPDIRPNNLPNNLPDNSSNIHMTDIIAILCFNGSVINLNKATIYNRLIYFSQLYFVAFYFYAFK